MINLKKIQFISILISSCILLPIFAAEPNEPNKPATELKFEMSNTSVQWRFGPTPGKGPIKPDFMAEFYIKSTPYRPNVGKDGQCKELLETNIGKSMSAKQKEFLETSSSYDTVSEPSLEMPIGYNKIHLFAVTQDDAKKMVKAFVEQINESTHRNQMEIEAYLRNLEQSFSQNTKDITEKQIQLEDIVKSYTKIKEDLYQFTSADKAVEFAKNSIMEMDKKFNDLDIELAGIRERIKSIEAYRNDPKQRAEIRAKLDGMYIDLMIELSGLEARRKVAKEIYAREQEFLDSYREMTLLQQQVGELSNSIEKSRNSIKKYKDMLNNPNSTLLEADIYQNIVTIFPVTDR